MTYEEAVKAYQALKRELGRVPYRNQLPPKAAYAITKKYPNWFDFLEIQGDRDKSPSDPKMSRYISNEQLIAEINDVYRKLGYPPHKPDYARTNTAITRFGSWKKFIKAAGIKATYVGYSQFTKEEVIYQFQKYIDKNGHFPVTDEVPTTGISIDTVLRLFGSLRNLAKIFGTHPRRVAKAEEKEKKVLEAANFLRDANKPITRDSIAEAAQLKASQVSGVVARYKNIHHIKRLSFVNYMKIQGFDAINGHRKKHPQNPKKAGKPDKYKDFYSKERSK